MTKIGKISGSHGVKGLVVFEHQLHRDNNFNDWDALMIEMLPGSMIPFFIERIAIQSDTSCLVKLEEINSPEDAKEILQKNVYPSPNVKTESIQTKKDVDSYIGYTIFDKEKEIGVINNILNPKSNPLFILNEEQENELLIPANEELILGVDSNKKVITMDLPEGLI